ncbi:uncharacterized protein LOC141849038 [Brevipalpus obovatus]|uniref:uncharacterized protein LOC141849038 n=1 Tax=Brevipalpus obovatus TaxID=246614 RepID=UPI003D9DB19B
MAEKNERTIEIMDVIKEPISIGRKSHHFRDQLCTTRAKYREGRNETAVKVFTVNDESKYLLIFGVPKIKLDKEVASLCLKYGPLEEVRQVKDYPQEDKFSMIYMIKFRYFLNAIYAKKKLDDLSFMGSCLHVCYAPELETVEETRNKLIERKRMVEKKCAKLTLMNKKKTTYKNHSKLQKQQAKEPQEGHHFNLPDYFPSSISPISTMNSKDFLVRQSMIYAWKEDTKEDGKEKSVGIVDNQSAGPSKQTQDNYSTSDHHTLASASDIAISNLRDVDQDNLITNRDKKRPRINWRSNNNK